uniref:Uncharacterized protein n=1 Tax=viral metagenome TaxID=1070528 RepID=A0A6C0AMA9_9ZZZZ
MDVLRYIRIAEIARYDLEYANECLLKTTQRLVDLKSVKYEANIPDNLVLDIHLTVDDKYLIEKRIADLLDQQLDTYYAQQRYMDWDKKNACNLLRGASHRNITIEN